MKSIFVYFIKIFLRNKGAIFGSLITPILFLVLFGFVFGDEDTKEFNIGLYMVPERFVETLETNSLKYKMYQDEDSLKNAIKKGKIDIGITYEKGEREFTFYYNKGNLKDAFAIKGTIETIITMYEKKIHTLIDPFPLRFHTVEIGKAKTTSLGYLIPGVISMSILSLGMFSIIEIFSRYRKLGLLKRFSVTPLDPFSFMSGIILGRLLLGIITAYVIYFMSEFIFHLHLPVNSLMFIVSLFIAGICMSGFGAAISLIFREANTASNVGSILFTIMLFFSGVYFPLNLLPKGVRLFSYVFPLTYVAQNMRYAMGVEYINYRFFIFSNLIMLIAGLLMLKITSEKYMGKML